MRGGDGVWWRWVAERVRGHGSNWRSVEEDGT